MNKHKLFVQCVVGVWTRTFCCTPVDRHLLRHLPRLDLLEFVLRQQSTVHNTTCLVNMILGICRRLTVFSGLQTTFPTNDNDDFVTPEGA